MFQSNDQHHPKEGDREQPFGRETAYAEKFVACEVFSKIVPTGDRGGHVDQSQQHKEQSQNIDKALYKDGFFNCDRGRGGVLIRHIGVQSLGRLSRADKWAMAKRRAWMHVLLRVLNQNFKAWRTQAECDPLLPKRAQRPGGTSRCSRRTDRLLPRTRHQS